MELKRVRMYKVWLGSLAGNVWRVMYDSERKLSEGAASSEAWSLVTGEVLPPRSECPLVILRCRDAGVHIGLLARYDGSTGDAELYDGRRLWSWNGDRHTLHEVALHGVTSARISEVLPGPYVVGDVAEVLPVSDEARPSLTTSRWHNG